jgi:Sulfatase
LSKNEKMKNHLSGVSDISPAWWWPLRAALFWMIFFAGYRVAFLLYHRDQWLTDSPHDGWWAILYAWRLDLSTTGYALALPIIVWWAVGMCPPAWRARAGRWVRGAVYAYTGFLICIATLILGINIGLYGEWKTVINQRVWSYLEFSSVDLVRSLSLMETIGSALLLVAMVWSAYWLFCRIAGWGSHGRSSEVGTFQRTKNDFYDAAGSRYLAFGLGLLYVAGAAGAIRGGFGMMPINESAVYHSTYMPTNHAATNAVWHLLHSTIEVRNTVHRYRFVPDSVTQAEWPRRATINYPDVGYQIDPLLNLPDTVQPNVVFVLMESMTAQVVAELDGEKGVTPNLSRIIREGILFDQCYASGFRTDQGVVAVLAGYPAQPDQSIIFQPEKAATLTSVAHILGKKGYSTAFYMGSDAVFANMGMWMRNMNFTTVQGLRELPASLIDQRWGVSDKPFLRYVSDQLGGMKEPFLGACLTLSLHAPYDTPASFDSPWKGRSEPSDRFRHAAAYADAALGEFVDRVRATAWGQRTVFVFVADHGHPLPADIGPDMAASHRVPWVIWSPNLRKNSQNKRFSMVCGHHDVPATVLGLMAHDSIAKPLLPWSRQVLHSEAYNSAAMAPYSGYAYFTNEDGMGWICPNGAGFYNFKSGEFYNTSGQLSRSDQEAGLGYLSYLYADFLSR